MDDSYYEFEELLEESITLLKDCTSGSLNIGIPAATDIPEYCWKCLASVPIL